MKQNIKALRYSANLSCSEAAAMVGDCHTSTWKRWEAEGRMPEQKYENLKLYAKLYKAMLAEFEKTRGA